jgi:hypothetical protein
MPLLLHRTPSIPARNLCLSFRSFVCHSAALLFVIPQRFCLSFRSVAEESAFLHRATLNTIPADALN